MILWSEHCVKLMAEQIQNQDCRWEGLIGRIMLRFLVITAKLKWDVF